LVAKGKLKGLMLFDDRESRNLLHYHIGEFIDKLREHRDSVGFLNLSLENLLTVLILPREDEPIFIEVMTKQLALASTKDKIADHL
jgi:hypothetical protein